MNIKKVIVLGFSILILLAVTILASCGGNDMQSKKASDYFSKLTEKENLDNLSLTIYYINPSILTRAPLSVDNLINHNAVHRIVVPGIELTENSDLFKNIGNVDFIPVKKKSRINARLYYIFEAGEDGKIVDVAMWGDDSSVFVNGVEVKDNDVFYDVIRPFLTEDAVKELEIYFNREGQ